MFYDLFFFFLYEGLNLLSYVLHIYLVWCFWILFLWIWFVIDGKLWFNNLCVFVIRCLLRVYFGNFPNVKWTRETGLPSRYSAGKLGNYFLKFFFFWGWDEMRWMFVCNFAYTLCDCYVIVNVWFDTICLFYNVWWILCSYFFIVAIAYHFLLTAESNSN